MKKLLNSLFLISIAVLFFSCSNDSGPFEDEFVNYDIMQLVSQNKEKGTTFSFYVAGNNDEVIYTDVREVIDTTKVKLGDCLLLGYKTMNKPYESGNIIAIGYTPILNDKLRVSEDGVDNEMPDWKRDGIYLYSIWRMGNFINVHGRLVYSDEDKELVVVIDRKDVNQENPLPTLRLIHRTFDPVENFEREFYASFDISAIWKFDWLEGVQVELNNLNLKQDTFLFYK
ncbi:MAG: hypothetical protein J1E99_02815 [Muribaculaceae bacterium]|nr:hypothetical protein [Muribaculaceae bacterium]